MKKPVPDKLRALADGLTRQIEDKRRSGLENTPKRQKEASSRRIEADHLERVQRCLAKLADAAERGEDLGILSTFAWTKANLLKMLRTRIDCPSYYRVCDTGVYSDMSPEAVELRHFLEDNKTDSDVAKDAERQYQNEIRELENEIKFSNIPGFFPTPESVIDTMLHYAEIRPGHRVLEPSAGKGDLLIRANAEADGMSHVRQPSLAVEVNRTLAKLIAFKIPGQDLRWQDFLTCNGELGLFDRVVMNPPFEKGQDVAHVLHAFRHLKDGGRLVAVMSGGVTFRSGRKYDEFRQFVDREVGEFVELPSGAFSGSDAFRQTGVSAQLLVIDKQ